MDIKEAIRTLWRKKKIKMSRLRRENHCNQFRPAVAQTRAVSSRVRTGGEREEAGARKEPTVGRTQSPWLGLTKGLLNDTEAEGLVATAHGVAVKCAGGRISGPSFSSAFQRSPMWTETRLSVCVRPSSQPYQASLLSG